MVYQPYLIPNAGDTVLIECGDQRFYALVETKSPRGNFSVSWHSGANPHAPWLRGHWYTEFGPNGEPKQDGEPKHGWRIVEIVKDPIPGMEHNRKG